MPLLAMRPGERRNAWAAFLTLFGLIASHSILETARDALFLAKVPASQLAWVYLAVALVSLALVRAQSIVARRLLGSRAITGCALTAAAVTFALYTGLGGLGHAGVYALYVWSGALTTLLLIPFWTLLGELFTVPQAKRLYGFIGAGSVLGAIAGSFAASALARVAVAETLVAIAAAGFAVTALVPALFRSTWSSGGAQPAPRVTSTYAANLEYVRQSPYARRVVASLLAATMCLTFADFIFKSMVADLVPKAELGAFLGTVYFALNIASLACQLTVASWVVKRFSLGAALAILPVLLAIGGAGVAIGGGLVAVLALKGADGTLRYSLHRTASELLFLPLSDAARQRVKGFMDVVGQRGGQVLASLAILLFSALHASPRALAVVLVLLAGAWAASAIALRTPYVEVFRARLKSGRNANFLEYPELDVASLETLFAALDSSVDAEVIAALDVLERENKARLIPALILYHPAEAVVERALAIFTRARRTTVVHVIDRLLDHSSARVRAATIAARSVLAPDAKALIARLSIETSPEVRATISVNLIASGESPERLDALLAEGTKETRIALADAIARRGVSGFGDALITLIRAPEVDVRRAAAVAMGSVKDPILLPVLIERLTDEMIRRDVERVLAMHGDEALAVLGRALDDPLRPLALRWRIPRAMSMFDAASAAAALTARLPSAADYGVRYQIIRALERIIRRDASVVLDRAILDATIDQTVSAAYHLLDARLILARGADEVAARKTPGHALLVTLLADQEKNTIERLFHLIGLAHPTEDFTAIHRGLETGKDARATSLELIDNVLSDPLRAAVHGLVDDVPGAERLMRAGKYHRTLGLGYDALLAKLVGGDDAAASVARFHGAELAPVHARVA